MKGILPPKLWSSAPLNYTLQPVGLHIFLAGIATFHFYQMPAEKRVLIIENLVVLENLATEWWVDPLISL